MLALLSKSLFKPGWWVLTSLFVCLFASHVAIASDEVMVQYADIAQATYSDSLQDALELELAIRTFIENPSASTLQNAKDSWLNARVSYQQTEVFRFGNPLVDEWEVSVNAWPLDEGLIDYVNDAYIEFAGENTLYNLNLIANSGVSVGGENLDTSVISDELLRKLNEAGGHEANVTTGYHAIEFLLWGQDLNGTGPGAGNRPHTDYDSNNCTGGHCDRRAQYLQVVTNALVDDLKDMVQMWSKDGAARKHVMSFPVEKSLSIILTGMGSLAFGEMAGQRMKLGLLLNDPEEEHDCFSDNTHNSHYYNGVGIDSVYKGRYRATDGSVLEGPSLSDLVRAKDPALDKNIRSDLDAMKLSLKALVDSANNGVAYDQLLAPGSSDGKRLIGKAIDDLVALTKNIERIVAALKIDKVIFQDSSSLGSPTSLFR